MIRAAPKPLGAADPVRGAGLPTGLDLRGPLGRAILWLAVGLAAVSVRGQAPTFAASGPDAAAYGEADNYPVGNRETWGTKPFVVGSHSRFDSIFPTHRVARAKQAWQFSRADAAPAIRYDFKGKTYTLEDYLGHFPVTGLLILQGDTILLERYHYGRTDKDAFVTASMAKSVLSLLAGIALGDGSFHSLEDEAARYVPELSGALYGEATLRSLLQMSSGVTFETTVNGVKGTEKTQVLIDGLFDPRANPLALLAAASPRAHPVGTHFDYSPGDNETLGIALRRATGKTLSEYLSERLWQPMGAEADASWWADPTGQEFPSAGFSAVLRDYARLGRLLAHDGNWNGRQLVPRQYLLDATTHRPEDRHLAPGLPSPYYGYGYQFWIFPGERRMFMMWGAKSQYVFVDPLSKLVMVQTSVYSEGVDSGNGNSECMALWLGLVRQLGEEPQ
ncbi:MAG: serine hydrolase [Opitutaceae bacterium]